MFVVWVPMVDGDDEAAARESAKIFTGDTRVTQMWDGGRKIGAAYRDAHSPASPRTEWDIYLWYGEDATWRSPAPEPFELLRQFDMEEAGSVLARGSTTGERYVAPLAAEIAKATDRLLSAPAPERP